MKRHIALGAGLMLVGIVGIGWMLVKLTEVEW